MNVIKNISLIAAAAFVVSGCSIMSKMTKPFTNPTAPVETKDGKIETQTAEETELAINHILDGEWTVANVAGQEVTGDDRPYAIFDTTSVNPFILKVYANNGCNTLNGSLAVTPNGQMSPVSDFLSTMMFCYDAPYEVGINLAFKDVKAYNIEKVGEDYLLYMKNASDATLLTLRKSSISFLNGAWTVTEIAGNEVPDSAGVKMVIDVPELKVHGNTGCNILNGGLFIDPAKPNSIQFVRLATTRMMCPDAEREQQFLVALEEIETAIETGNGQKAVLKDSQGKTLIVLQRLDLRNAE